MFFIPRRLGLVMVLALAALAGFVEAADTAQVTTVKNVPYKGTVLVDQYDKIEIEAVTTNRETGAQEKKKVTLRPSEVRMIKYSPVDMDFLSGQNMLKQGRYAEALAKFDAALKDSKAGKWVGQYAGFYRAECLAKMAETDAKQRTPAIQAYEQLIAKHPKSRFLPHAYLGMATVYHGAGDTAKMASALGKLDPAKFGDEWKIRRKFWDATLLETKKAYDAAQKAYGALVAEAEKAKDPSMVEQALVSQGRCLLKAKKYDQGERVLFQVAKDAQEEETKAQIRNALGDSFWARGEVNEAMFQYLRVAVLYFEQPEEHAKALYWASKCFAKRGDPARAKELTAELKRDHKDSPWAKKK